MTVTAFDKPKLRELRRDIEVALAAVAQKHGIALDIGKVTFWENKFTTRLTGLTTAAAPSAPSLAALTKIFGEQNPPTEQPSAAAKEARDAAAPFGPNHRWTAGYNLFCTQIGLLPEELGKPVVVGGKNLRIGGYTDNSPRGEVILATLGKNPRYTIAPVDVVLKALGRS